MNRPAQSSLTAQRTYRLRPQTVHAIDDLAAQAELYQSEIVDTLLDYALAEIAAGRLRLRRRPIAWQVDGIEFAAAP